MNQRIAGVVSVIITAGLLCGCSPDDDPIYVSAADTNAEYRSTAANLELPPGEVFEPPRNADQAEDGNKVYYEVGIGEQDAQFFWYCAWATEATRSSDVSGALIHLSAVDSMALWDALDVNGRRMFREQAESAASGDTSQLEQFVASNCASRDETR